MNSLGAIATDQGQYVKAMGYYEQSLNTSQEIGDRLMEGITLNNLGFVAKNQGRYDIATSYCERSLVIAQEIGDPDGEGVALNNMGVLSLAQSAYPQAQTHFLQALSIRQELNQPHYLIEDWAGLVLVALRQGDIETAQMYTNQLLTAWTDNPTFEGAEQPMRAFHFAWQACRELELAQADEVLAAAAGVMQRYLDNQPDPEAQAVYLGQPHHRPLWEAWQEMLAG